VSVSCALIRGIMSETTVEQFFLRITTEIVSAYASRNQVSSRALQRLLESVYTEVARAVDVVAAPPNPRFDPAAAAVQSVFQDHIVCLEDGRKLKMLKRHLGICYDLTPAQYRQKWGLPSDYPMVAPDYAARRSALALKHGLGRKPVGMLLRRSRGPRSSAG
jgi:predicted transcriptional regulator